MAVVKGCFCGFVWIWCLLVAPAVSEKCERLKQSLTYTQEDAPRDLSGVIPVVVERINRVLDGVVDVEVEWTGANLHGIVGDHVIKCIVTRIASVVGATDSNVFVDEEGREVTSQCFNVPFTILDTNECTLPTNHPMRHRCHKSALCVNTDGSYECLCPTLAGGESIPEIASESFWENLGDRSPWEVAYQGSASSCSGKPSTYGCCPPLLLKSSSQQCRATFRCPTDPCKNHDCSSKATCQRTFFPTDQPNYTCQCPEGLMGNGRKCRQGMDLKPQPKVKFDGVTPTDETVDNNYYCDCTRPTVDACSGYPPCKGKHQICVVSADNRPTCACKMGYVPHEKYGCVDEKPPELRLNKDPNGDKIMRLRQGDEYKEHLVHIIDENPEEYMRSLKVSYSHPLLGGCLTKIGEFHVNYTVATPWTSPPYVRLTRRVIIEDIDECKLDVNLYRTKCPELIPKCDIEAGAKCVNTIGSYTCKCPRHTSGDGFLSGISFDPMLSPEGYQGGQGCRDTGKPVISVLGPNPKVFRVCECGGLSGVMGKKTTNDESMKRSQRTSYGESIKDMIRSTAGAELCATHSHPMPDPSDCISAYDETFSGRVDLSRKVVVGEPVMKTPMLWSVPYDVTDEAGNVAVTQYRDVKVEEVNLLDVEAKIRNEVLQQQKAEIQRAVDVAVDEERRKLDRTTRRSGNKCPECPPCDCSEMTVDCEATCASRAAETCTMEDARYLVESYLPPGVRYIFMAFLGIFFIRFLATLVFNPTAYRTVHRDTYRDDIFEDAHPGMDQPPVRRAAASPSFSSPGETLFGSPPPTTNNRRSSLDGYGSPMITPHKDGEGVGRRSLG